MPAPREKSTSASSAPKVNQAGEPTATQGLRPGSESVPPRKSAHLGEQKDPQRISEAAEANIPRHVTKNLPSHQEIELIAYEICLQRRGTEGSALEDWLQAERQLVEAFESQPEIREDSRTRCLNVNPCRAPSASILALDIWHEIDFLECRSVWIARV